MHGKHNSRYLAAMRALIASSPNGLPPRPRTLFEAIALFCDADRAVFVPRGLPEPTDAQPGSAEKIRVLAARLDAGLELHHPDDRTCFDDDGDPAAKLPEPTRCMICGGTLAPHSRSKFCGKKCAVRH